MDPSGWCFRSLERDAIYVYLCAPGSPDHPVPLPLRGLTPEYRSILAALTRGDRVPSEVVTALLALAARSSLQPPLAREP
jgi:hypothetical protein